MKDILEKLFKKQPVVIATMHQKENVIAPLFERELEVTCFTPKHFDTDLYGSFSGEFERKESPIETLKTKCKEAMNLTGCSMGIASEGSFGPHPFLPFAYADDEWMIFMDKKNGLEIIEREISSETNFSSAVVKSVKELNEFTTRTKFPSHGLIIQGSPTDFVDIKKGITEKETLETHFHYLIEKYGEAYIQTDMRAMFNPTRMQQIEKLANKLIQKIKSICPQCDTPGFGITKATAGLPCSLCGNETQSILSYTYTCITCNYHREDKYPHHKMFEEPMHCHFCNP
jgi:hypothetical protein